MTVLTSVKILTAEVSIGLVMGYYRVSKGLDMLV